MLTTKKYEDGKMIEIGNLQIVTKKKDGKDS